MKDEIIQVKATYGQIKPILDSLESKVNSLESQVSDFSEFATDTTEWMAEIHREVTGGKGRKERSTTARQEDQTEEE